MNILALELATAHGSVAWKSGDDAMLLKEWPNDRKNSGPFFAALGQMLEENGKPDTIVVGLGPGSYAGTRIAIATAVGLQAATKAHLLGAPSVCAMRTKARAYCVIGDARRQSFFVALVKNRELQGDPELVDAAQLEIRLREIDSVLPVLSSDSLPQFNRVERCFPSASILAELAAEANRSFALPPLQPMYLREPHITYPKESSKFVS
jgi:tRNA threonylcarbamoyl adenosine modification protein YeaZ